MKNNELTSKDVAYLSDIFEWNYIAVNKIDIYLKCQCDNCTSKKIKELSKLHKSICNDILKILGSGCKNE